MVVKTLTKQSFLSIKKTFKRFLSILAIVLLGVGFFTGIRQTSPNMESSIDEYFKKQNVYDINLMSTWGITDEEIEKLKNDGYDIEPSYSIDALIRVDDDYVVKVHSYDPNAKMNKLIVTDGRLPETNKECVIEKNKDLGEYKIGDTITIEDDNLKEQTLEIVGFVKSPLYVSRERGSTKLLNGKVNFYMYSLITNFNIDYYTEAYIKLNNNESTYSKKYEQLINSEEDKLEVITNEFIETRFNKEKNDALKELNDNIDKYNKEKKDAYKKLDDAKDKIDKNEKTLNSNLTKLNNNEKKAKETFKTKKAEIESNKKKVNDGIATITVNSKDVYMDYEVYNITIKNNSDSKLLIDDLQKTNSIFLTEEKGAKYSFVNYELTKEQLEVIPGATINISIKFKHTYRSDKKIKSLTFSGIQKEIDGPMDTENKDTVTINF